MRKQYHHRPVGPHRRVWDVHRLIRLSRDRPVVPVPLATIAEADEDWWYDGTASRPTPRALADHMALVERADLRHPIILCAEGRLMDGMHRVVKAILADRSHIDARRFDVTPAPDHVNVALDDLPYPDEAV